MKCTQRALKLCLYVSCRNIKAWMPPQRTNAREFGVLRKLKIPYSDQTLSWNRKKTIMLGITYFVRLRSKIPVFNKLHSLHDVLTNAIEGSGSWLLNLRKKSTAQGWKGDTEVTKCKGKSRISYPKWKIVSSLVRFASKTGPATSINSYKLKKGKET